MKIYWHLLANIGFDTGENEPSEVWPACSLPIPSESKKACVDTKIRREDVVHRDFGTETSCILNHHHEHLEVLQADNVAGKVVRPFGFVEAPQIRRVPAKRAPKSCENNHKGCRYKHGQTPRYLSWVEYKESKRYTNTKNSTDISNLFDILIFQEYQILPE